MQEFNFYISCDYCSYSRSLVLLNFSLRSRNLYFDLLCTRDLTKFNIYSFSYLRCGIHFFFSNYHYDDKVLSNFISERFLFDFLKFNKYERRERRGLLRFLFVI